MRTRMLRLGLAVVLLGCTPYRPKDPSVPPPMPAVHPIPHVAVVGFAVAQPAGDAPIPPAVGTGIARALARRLARAGVAVVEPEVVFRAAPRRDNEERAAAAVRVARQVGANRVVFGTVTRYRDGENASVAYEAVLVRALDGLVLAADRFDDAERAMPFRRGSGAHGIVEGALDATATRFAAAMKNGRESAPRRRSGGTR